MSHFKKEARYLVLKLKKLSGDDIDQIKHTLNRNGWDRALTDCVVVESDWPICQQVWGLIEQQWRDDEKAAGNHGLRDDDK